MSLITVLSRIGSLIFSIVANFIGMQEFNQTYWIVRSVGIVWHFLIIFLGHKFPHYLLNFESVFIMPSFLINNIYLHNSTTPNLFAINILGICLLYFVGVFLNNSWIPTSIGIIISTATTITIYIVRLHIYDITNYGIIVSFAGLSIYACYFFEKNMKLQFILLE